MEDRAQEADQRLEAALRESGRPDPRESCRGLLRELRGRSEGEYGAAVEDYRTSVIAAIAAGEAEPVGAWIEFGVRLATRLYPGRTVVLDGEGRAREYASGAEGDFLVLHLPSEKGPRAIPLAVPRRLTPAQDAAMDLLVHGKVKRRGEEGGGPTMTEGGG